MYISFKVIKDKVFLILFIFIAFSNSVNAQTAPKLVSVNPPSPNVAALQKYGDIPVSTYTGIPNISIPIYTIKSKDITVPISISYHASGIKVAEDASKVGLGWVLNAGGVISRNIVGTDDFLSNTYFNTAIPDFSDGQGPVSLMQSGCILNMFNRNNPNLPTLYTTDLTSYLGTFPPSEFQPDQYFYNFLSYSGKFILKRNKQAVIEKQEKMDFALTTTSSPTNNTWQVKAADGFIYDFNVFETYSDVGTPSDVHNTAWYLTKITSPAGNTVTFNYTTIANQLVTTIGSYSESIDAAELPVKFYSNVWYSNSFGTQKGIAPAKNYTEVVLNSIDFTNGMLKFNYSNNRLDLPGDQRLDSVSLYSKNSAGTVSATPLKTFAFSYSYFSAGDIDNDYMAANLGADANYKRLKLTQLNETGYYNNSVQAQSPYIFSYFEGGTNDLPSKASLARDHWGYYNGKSSNTSLVPSIIPVNSPDYITYILGAQGPERDPDPNFLKAFSLSSIKYPTGGSTDFDYEANDFDEEKSMINDHSLYQAKTLIAKSQLLVYDNQLTKSFANDTLNLSDEYIDYDPIQQVSLYAHLQVVFRFSSTALCSVGASGMLTFDIYDSTGRDLVSKDYQYFNQCTNGNTNSCLVCSSPVSTYNTDLNLVPGKYIVKVHCDNSLTTLQDIRFTFTYYTTVSASSIDNLNASARYSYAGGLRIRRITDHDGINPANDKIKKYIYHYFEDRDQDGTLEEYSYGRRMCKPQYNAFEWSDEHYVQTTGLPGDFSYMAPHYMRSSDSNVPLNGSAGGAVVGYDHVTVLYGENGENGKSEYSYINDPDQVSPYSEGGGLPCRPPYSASVPNPLNGSLIQEKDYKNVGGNFIIVKSIDNTYHLESFTNQGNENKVYGMEVRTPVLFEYGDSHTFTGTGSLPPCSSYLLSYLTLQSEWPHLDKTVEKDYAQNDTTSFNETVTNYFYDSKNYLPNKIVRNNSKNESLTSVTSYPFDYTTVTGSDAFSLGVKNLQAAHVYNTPVETYTSISNADGSNLRTVGAGLNSFQSAKPFPSVIYSSILSAPSASFAPASTSSGGSTKDASYKALIDFDSYDASGNILQQHKDNDVIHSYIWDYNSSLPVAEVANADNLSIAYSSFEADGKGNWTYSGTPSSTGGAITGSQSYLLSSGSITKSALTAANKYIISYWSKGTVSITGGTISSTLNGKSINGWQYHEVIITGATSISISGSVYIDELRLYPYDAQMTTYTYQPLIGLTSQCGTDNRIQYYEYDGLGRLQDIKDADGNIIKTFEYHYQQ